MNGTAQSYWLGRLGTADAYNDWIFAQIAPHLGGRVLEIGCGNGNFTQRLATCAQHVLAVDLDGEFVAQAQQRTAHLSNVTVLRGDVTTMDWPGQFNAVVMLDVLEHIEDDTAMLRSLFPAFAPGGRLVIKVPAMPSIYNSLDRAVGHFRRYSRANLRRAVADSGYRSEAIWGFNLVGAAGWWLNGSLLRRSVPPSEHISGFNHLVPVLRRLESILRPPTGASLFIIARPDTGTGQGAA